MTIAGKNEVEEQGEKNALNGLISSEFHYYFGRFANTSLVLFFLTRPLSISPLSYSLSLYDFFIFFAAGYLAWTFFEYVLHRWLYHEIQSIFAKGHDMHHDEPLSLLGMPWIVNTVAVLVIYFSLATAFDAPKTGVFVGSFWLGYLWYTLIHHGLHHWKTKANWYKKLWRHHSIHHKLPNKNLGVSTMLWDRIFRTKV